jgi:2-hydroxy-6-oxonona-2,4-dienedioate hydrolase
MSEFEPWDALERSARARWTACGDVQMIWRLWGSGEPLILLHGGAGSWLHWFRVIPALAARRLVIVPDLPGLGSSALPPAGADGPELAAILLAGLAQVLGPEVAYDLAGFSFGGVLAGLMAATAPAGTARSLTLVGSGGLGVIRGTVSLVRVRDKSGFERAQAHRTNLSRWMIADPGKIDDLAVAIQDWNSHRARFDSRPIGTSDVLLAALPGLRIPVTGIWGGHDHAVEGRPERAEAVLRRLCPGLAFTVIPDAGHWVAHEAPDAFAGCLVDALSPFGPPRS